jgi:hypothetical protein
MDNPIFCSHPTSSHFSTFVELNEVFIKPRSAAAALQQLRGSKNDGLKGTVVRKLHSQLNGKCSKAPRSIL